VGERFDDHQRAIGVQVIAYVGAGSGRVAHVMQAVEKADQVVAAVEGGRRGDFEAHPIGQSRIGGSQAGRVDGSFVRVEADHGGGRIRLREQDR
jgi:hypothetical protein